MLGKKDGDRKRKQKRREEGQNEPNQVATTRHKLNKVKSLTKDKKKTFVFYPQMHTDRRREENKSRREGKEMPVKFKVTNKLRVSSTVSHRSTHTQTHTQAF